MEIILENVGKRFNRDWIFRGMNITLRAEEPTVILGANGSGKSTLLQVLSGYMDPSEGTIKFKDGREHLPIEKIFRKVSYSGPLLKLYDELSLEEIIDFHHNFKSFRSGFSKSQIIDTIRLEKHRKKQLKNFSSGMRQRVKLALAILSETPLLFLDEPTSNLDRQGIAWYKEMMEEHRSHRLVVVCSNRQEHEYEFCTRTFQVEDYK